MTILPQDSYVRLTFASFRQAEIVHLFSGMDEDRPTANGIGANFSAITGYTEWISNSKPAITIGWDWKLTSVQGTARLIHAGIPGSNLMLLNQHNQDLGSERTRQLLVTWLEVFNWQSETLSAISIRSTPVNFDSCSG
jgi:Domain of unknown function (DUF4902)